MRARVAFACLIAVACAPATDALAGTLFRPALLEPDFLRYQDESDAVDRVTALEEPGAIVFERPADGAEIRSAALECGAESPTRVRCAGLGGVTKLGITLNGGDDSFDGGTLKNFSVVAVGGSGHDTLTSGTKEDALAGEAGNDTLTGGSGTDNLNGGDGDDRIVSRDNDQDVVDCGPGNDHAFADAGDQLAGCETVEFPPRVAPVGTPPPPILRTEDVVRLPAVGCVKAPLRIRVARVGSFVPLHATVFVNGRLRSILERRPLTYKLKKLPRRPFAVEIWTTAEDGRRLQVERTYKRC